MSSPIHSGLQLTGRHLHPQFRDPQGLSIAAGAVLGSFCGPFLDIYAELDRLEGDDRVTKFGPALANAEGALRKSVANLLERTDYQNDMVDAVLKLLDTEHRKLPVGLFPGSGTPPKLIKVDRGEQELEQVARERLGSALYAILQLRYILDLPRGAPRASGVESGMDQLNLRSMSTDLVGSVQVMVIEVLKPIAIANVTLTPLERPLLSSQPGQRRVALEALGDVVGATVTSLKYDHRRPIIQGPAGTLLTRAEDIIVAETTNENRSHMIGPILGILLSRFEFHGVNLICRLMKSVGDSLVHRTFNTKTTIDPEPAVAGITALEALFRQGLKTSQLSSQNRAGLIAALDEVHDVAGERLSARTAAILRRLRAG